MVRKLLNFTLNPQAILFKAWRRTGFGSFKTRLEYDVLRRPHYGFCVYYAARLAHRLGLERISVAEFGVAGGSGLIELERMAEEVERLFPVTIEVYGFDTGEGLPDPEGYRDLPYIWKPGFYKMDREALERRLSRSKLVLGNVADTVPTFFDEHDPAPLGAGFFDLDFWSSTRDAFKIFDVAGERMLPRVYCYCDDVLSSPAGGLLNEYVGQLAAIRDYNQLSDSRKLTTIAGLEHARRIAAGWNDQIYIHHAFEHPQYNTYVHADADRQLGI